MHEGEVVMPRAILGELPHQRHWVDLAADWRIAGDDAARQQLERQPALGEFGGGGDALLLAQRVTRREGLGTEFGFGVGHVLGPQGHHPPCAPLRTEAGDPVFQRRWCSHSNATAYWMPRLRGA